MHCFTFKPEEKTISVCVLGENIMIAQVKQLIKKYKYQGVVGGSTEVDGPKALVHPVETLRLQDLGKTVYQAAIN